MWSDEGAESWVAEVLRWGYQIPFRWAPTLSRDPIPLPAYAPSSIRGKALEGEVQALLNKGAIELAPLPSPGFYSRLFVVMKASGSWRPVIDLSTLNLRIQQTSFKMETLQSVLLSVRPGDWMVSLDLKDAYLQVPMHPDSRKFLRFMVGGKVYQFKVLCFGLSTAPQVFTRVMAPVSAILHRMGVRLRRYLDDWLLQASSREQILLALRTVLWLCRSLGIVVNWEKSQVIPTQQMVYLGVILDSTAFRASPALKRVEKLLSIGDVFLSCVSQPVSSWLELLGVLSSMIQLVPGGRLRMRSLQLALRRQWDQVDQSQLVEWSPVIQQDLSWWLDRDRLVLGVSLEQVSPQLELWSDTSDVSWGAHLDEQVASGLWAPEDIELSINARELLAIESSQVVCSTFCRFLSGGLRRQFDSRVVSEEPGRDSLFFSELHRAEDSPLGGGSVCSDFLTVHYGETQCSSGHSFSPKPDLGLRVDAEAGGLRGSVQEMAGFDRPVCNISKSQMFNIFLSLPRSQCSGDGCASSKLEWVAGVCLSSLVTHSGGFEEAPVVLWGPADHHSSVLASEAVVSGSNRSGGRRSGSSSTIQRPASASLPSFSSGSVQAVSSCLETIKRFTRAGGFSKRVAQQVSLARRPSSRAGYQSKRLVFRQWCRSEGHSISRPSLPKIADFLFWLRRSRRLSVSSVMGYRSMLSAVFKSVLPEISTSPVLHDLLRSFQVEAPIREVRPPSWDLTTVLTYLRSSSFELLTTISLRDLTRKTLFLLSLATAKRVGEIQALSRRVSFSSSAAGLSYVPEFVAKTESALRPLPRSFEVQSLGDFAAGMPTAMSCTYVVSLFRSYVGCS